jgi:predicted nucleotidyltransferase
MSKTAHILSVDEESAYAPESQLPASAAEERWERAWDVARVAARLLRERLGATRVVVFGSLAHRSWFTPWSDIDLAAWGIAPDRYYRAVALVSGLSPEFEVDLVAVERCRPALRRVIESEGVEL